ncbi:lmo0937 family membrane protein [Cellulophaga sp. HaHaR_3_176]|nr:lmo0937 family membrane protein [Cellulophaga sp. HaHaR_3_176]
MLNILKSLSVFLLILWALGFFYFNIGPIIHVLLLIATAALIVTVLKKNN